MQTALVFTNGKSQTVRLPEEFWFDDGEVVVKRLGDAVVLLPRKYRAESLLAMLEEIGPMDLERKQPADPQERDFG